MRYLSLTVTNVRDQSRSNRRLAALFDQVLAKAPLPKDGLICAIPIPNFIANRLGRDEEGNVCLLIAAPPGARLPRPDVRLQNLTVRRRVRCDVQRPGGEREVLEGTAIICRAESAELRRFFLDLFDQALPAFGQSPREEDVDWWVEHATRLFTELETSDVREIRGLWGELLVICEASDPATLVRRWHESPEDRYDFTAGSFALEVKTCTDLERIHIFSLSQIRPTTEMEVIIASVPVVPDLHGQSAMDLLSEIEDRISDEQIRDKLRSTAFRVGGAALAQGPRRFDRRAASEGMRLMRAAEIPAIEERLSPVVLDVKLQIRCRDVSGQDLKDSVEARLSA